MFFCGQPGNCREKICLYLKTSPSPRPLLLQIAESSAKKKDVPVPIKSNKENVVGMDDEYAEDLNYIMREGVRISPSPKAATKAKSNFIEVRQSSIICLGQHLPM